MKIQQWIKLTGAKKTVLARLIGISNPRMTRILKHGLVPHPEEMVKFYWVSLGTVRPEDWYDLATVPPDLQRLFEPQSRKKPCVRVDDIQAGNQSNQSS